MEAKNSHIHPKTRKEERLVIIYKKKLLALNTRRSHPCWAHPQSSASHITHPLNTWIWSSILLSHPMSTDQIWGSIPPYSLPSFPIPDSLRLVLPCLYSSDCFWLTFVMSACRAEPVGGWERLPHTGTNFWCLLIGTHCMCKSSHSHPVHTSAYFILIHITPWSIFVLWQPYLKPDSPAHISGLLTESKTWVTYKIYF